ncbi:MAG TPA: hypothetical protein VHN11_04845 [Xanthobacteraceae bacterium]|nr:hypothetical protein [Xanthobacteraceae bacterium]
MNLTMTIIINRRHFLEAANAYVKARQPTSALALSLFETLCQMVADDLEAPVSVVLENHVVTRREPR